MNDDRDQQQEAAYHASQEEYQLFVAIRLVARYIDPTNPGKWETMLGFLAGLPEPQKEHKPN